MLSWLLRMQYVINPFNNHTCPLSRSTKLSISKFYIFGRGPSHISIPQCGYLMWGKAWAGSLGWGVTPTKSLLLGSFYRHIIRRKDIIPQFGLQDLWMIYKNNFSFYCCDRGYVHFLVVVNYCMLLFCIFCYCYYFHVFL